MTGKEEKEDNLAKSRERLSQLCFDLGFSVRVRNVLGRYNNRCDPSRRIDTLEVLKATPEWTLRAIQGMGTVAFEEVQLKLGKGTKSPAANQNAALEEKLDRVIELLESVIGDGGNGWSVIYTCPGQEPGL